jgi:hypothetical protein
MSKDKEKNQEEGKKEKVDPRSITFTNEQFVKAYHEVVTNGGGTPKLIKLLGLETLESSSAKNKINGRKQTLTKQGLSFPDLRSHQAPRSTALSEEDVAKYQAMLTPPAENDEEAEKEVASE